MPLDLLSNLINDFANKDWMLYQLLIQFIMMKMF